MWFRNNLLGAVVALACGLVLAQALPREVDAALIRAKVPRQAVTLLVVDAEGKLPARLNHQANVLMNPASVMKLVTTYAALDLLGPAYTWRTPVYVEGVVQGGTLLGNLYILGQGDPKLVQAAAEMASRVKIMGQEVSVFGKRVQEDFVNDFAGAFAAGAFSAKGFAAEFKKATESILEDILRLIAKMVLLNVWQQTLGKVPGLGVPGQGSQGGPQPYAINPNTGQPDPEKLKAYAATHPDAMALTTLASHHRPTANYYQTTYFSIHTFKFIDAKGTEHLVKWRFIPRDGTKEMTAAEMKELVDILAER